MAPKKVRTKAPSKKYRQALESVSNVSKANKEAHAKKETMSWEIGADGVNPCYIESVPTEILDMIIKLVVTNYPPTRSERGLKVDRTIHAAFTYPPVDKAAHHRLRSVCRTWAKATDATHREVHFDGHRSPAPMFICDAEYLEPGGPHKGVMEEEFRESDFFDENGEEIIAGEVRRTQLELERIPTGAPVSLTLIKPRYNADPWVLNAIEPGWGFQRPGLTKMVNSVHKGDLATLTIDERCDTAWVECLLNEAEEDELEVPDQEWQDQDLDEATAIMKNFHDVYEKMYARQPPKPGPYQTRRQVALAKKEDEKVWKKLHTLRLMFDGRPLPDRLFIKLSPLKFPALRRVELHLCGSEPLHLWVLPYSQITHLTLGYDGTSNFILLEMLKLARLSLESLTVRLLRDSQHGRGYSYDHQGPCIDFPKLEVLHVHSVYTGTAKKSLEQFFEALTCRNLRTFHISTEDYEYHIGPLTPAANFIKRSGCTVRELYIDIDSGSSLSESDGAALEVLMRDHSDALEVFHFHGGICSHDWLGPLTAPRLRELNFTCFWLPAKWEEDAAAFPLRVLHWAKGWATGGLDTQHSQSRQRHSQLAVRFCAVPSEPFGHLYFYDMCELGTITALSPPHTVEAMRDELVEAGMKIDLEWWEVEW
ncbi:hypothetical protein D9611_013829 [Ephemerocybe angulata]|uniref:Uncharacterized protein n=1 Tax=Ephemerocybe angulata TaxID=980116 RepID=A0A8H5C3Q2_9AGAR|nr:hypothetical protein D9611_013829 [Tulosesus angulatus]